MPFKAERPPADPGGRLGCSWKQKPGRIRRGQARWPRDGACQGLALLCLLPCPSVATVARPLRGQQR